MRTLLHLLSVILVLPGLALASAFVILGRAIAAGSLWGMLNQLLMDALWLVPWGLLAVCTLLLVIAAGGLSIRTRWLAASCVAVLGVGSTGIVLALTVQHSNATLGQVPFFIPSVVALGIGAWLALTERPSRRSVARSDTP